MEYLFGTGQGKVPPETEIQVDAIARKHGAHFVNATMPDGDRHWFSKRNQGAPFDQQTARAVRDDLRAAGLLDDDGRFVVPK